MQSSQWGKHPGRVSRGRQQESMFRCLLRSGSRSGRRSRTKNVSGIVNLKAVRTLLRKGPQLLKAAPPVGGQGLNHMGLWEVFHFETTAGRLQGLAGREDMGHFVEIHSATRRQL